MARRMLLVVIVGLMSMPADAASDIDFGPYHALIIGIDDYQYLPPLTTAVNDALAVAEVLRERYDFTATVLLDPDRSEILRALERLRLVLTEGDNLLIYYAGRAIVDIEAETSYWQPADAERGAVSATGQPRFRPDSLVGRCRRAIPPPSTSIVVRRTGGAVGRSDSGHHKVAGGERHAARRRRGRRTLRGQGFSDRKD